MRFQIEQDWRSYLRLAEETTSEVLAGSGSLVAAIDEFDHYFRTKLFVDAPGLPPTSGLLAMHAYMTLLAGLRMAVSGHATASFPLYRAGLEASCYAFQIAHHKDREQVWLSRNNGEREWRFARKTFTSAVSDTASAIGQIQSGSGDIIMQGYQWAIEFGAHPNPRSIFPHMTEPEDAGGHWAFRLTGLHTADGIETTRALIAYLDFAWAIALVIFRMLPASSQEQAEELRRLNDRKNEVAAEFQADEGE